VSLTTEIRSFHLRVTRVSALLQFVDFVLPAKFVVLLVGHVHLPRRDSIMSSLLVMGSKPLHTPLKLFLVSIDVLLGPGLRLD